MRGVAALVAFTVLALPGAARGAETPADPWPRQFKSGSATILVYQPQVESWTGNVLNFRCAIAITKGDPKDDVFGVIWAKARTQVDKVSRIVLLEDVAVTRRDFPTLADNGLFYLFALRTQLGPGQRTVALDRLEASLAAAGPAAPQGIPVGNDPPGIIVSDSPAVLVSIDGPPALRSIPNTSFQRIINTRALILADEGARTFFLHVYDGWISAESLAGPWRRPAALPEGLAAAARQIAATGIVDMLEAANDGPKPSLETGVPAIYVSETPAELMVFVGPPAFTPVAGTSLEWASNTTANVFLDPASTGYFALLAGRWFRAAAIVGPWVFVPSTDLPADFKKIPVNSPAGAVLAAVAGTPQAGEALIADSIPQTATVKRVGGPTFAPTFDGAPQLSAVAGTSLLYVVNSPTPIIRLNPTDYYALKAGIWFTAPALFGPWIVAPSVPDEIYAIPPSSPLHHVTYVQIYGATLGFVYEGYTPGYLGTVATTDGVVVYGTGYADQPWVGSAWYPGPATYTTADLPYSPRGTTSGNVYGYYGDAVTSGTRSYFSSVPATPAGAESERRTTYTNPKTGKTSAYGSAKAGNDVYADKNGQIYSNAGGQWQQRSPTGWSSASGDTSWADKESQARSAGEERFNGCSQVADRAEDGKSGASSR
jgi:hypothetical protein